MGKTRDTGFLNNCVFTDSSNNVGIGGAANASYKLAVTGASLFSSSILANSVMSLGDDGTYGATYKTLGLTGNTNGTHRILAGTSDDMYIAAATGRGVKLCVNGSITSILNIASTGAATFSSSLQAASGTFTQSAGNSLQAFQTTATNATTAIIRQTGAGGNGGQDIGLLVDIQGANDLDNIANFRYYNGSTYTSRMVVKRGGNVGIGTSSPSAKLEITNGRILLNNGYSYQFYNTAGTAVDTLQMFTDGNVYLDAKDSTGGNLIFRTSNSITERMRITSGGYTQMSPNGTYFSSGSAYHEMRNINADTITRFSNTSTNPFGISIYFTGADPNNVSNYIFQGYSSATATSLYTIWANGTTSGRSDIRLKKNIVDATPKLDKLMQLRVVNYEWIESLNGTKEIGLIAQEVEEVFPNLIITEPIIKKREIEQKDGTVIEEEYQDGDSKSIKHSVLPFMLLKALQEANTKIDELSAKVTALENK